MAWILLDILGNTLYWRLIDFIMKYKEKQGYSLGNSKKVTQPFADDFEILSNNKDFHQNLQDIVQINSSTMGLTFKPSKCRSLSIWRRRSKPEMFLFPAEILKWSVCEVRQGQGKALSRLHLMSLFFRAATAGKGITMVNNFFLN